MDFKIINLSNGRSGGVILLWKINIHVAFLITLDPEKDGADGLHDYRPISLIHSLIKLLSKVLARCLAPKLDKMVAQCQSAFIKNV
jgi:hypothetical protein